MIKDDIFMTKDIAIIKAKLSIFDYYFGGGPYDNRYYKDIKKSEERINKITKILAVAIPATIILFTGVGFTMGFRFHARIN